MRRVDGRVEVLAEVRETKEEIPADFKLSPKGNFLVIRFNTGKLQLLDVTTKEIKDILLPATVSDVGFSSDGKELLLLEQQYVGDTDDLEVVAYRFDIATQVVRNIHRTIVPKKKPLSYIALQWRRDEKVLLLLQPNGHDGTPAYFDLVTGELKETLPRAAAGYFTVSNSGESVAIADLEQLDSCNDFGNFSAGQYTIYDPISGAVKGYVGDSQKINGISGFSPDDREIVHFTEEPRMSEFVCGDIAPRTYFLTNLTQRRTQTVSNPVEILRQWNIVAVELYVDEQTQEHVIAFGGKPILSSKESLELIAAYYP